MNDFPTLPAVDEATHLQLAVWYRFLRTPADDYERRVLNHILYRFEMLGGWTPEISKAVGWKRS